MSLFTTEWLRASDDDARRPAQDYGLRYGREARARRERERDTLGGYRNALSAPPSFEACCPA